MASEEDELLAKVVDIITTEANHKLVLVEASQRSHGSRISTRSLARIYGAVEKLANGKQHDPLRVATHVTLSGIPSNITGLRALYLIPWLRITGHDNNTVTLQIDQELRAICEARAPRPELNGFSVTEFYRHLRAEIRRRREANDQARKGKNWSHEGINKLELVKLLDWIERELDRVPQS
jgi:hypothetical protein